MKKTIIIFLSIFFSTFIYSQSWFQMGNLDTLGNINGQKVVSGISFYENKITIGGNFKKENSTVLNGIAQWTTNNWAPMGIGVWATPAVDSAGNGGGGLEKYKNEFYSAGVFFGAGGNYISETTHVCSDIAKWNGIDWNPLSGPNPPPSGFNNSCWALKVYHNNLYAGGYFGGSFDSNGIHPTQGISKWNDTIFSAVGQMDGDFPPNGDFAVLDFCIYQNKLIAGGAFTSIDGSAFGTYSGIAAWDDTNWSALGVGFNNTVSAVTVYNGELYAGGIFTATRDNLTPLNHIAKWNGTQWQAVGEGLNDTVLVLTVDSVNNKLYAGGAFTQTGLGVQAKHIAEWTGSNWQEVGGGTNNDVFSLFAKDSNLYVGGRFTRAGNVQTSLMACWGYGLSVGVGREESGVRSQELVVAPNPNDGEFIVSTKYNVQSMKIEIRNVLGQIVYKDEEKNTNQTSIKLDAMAGIYFMSIVADDGSTSSPQVRMNGKIIKQ